MQAGRQAPLQNEAGTSPAPVVQERWQKGNFREGVEAGNSGGGPRKPTIREAAGKGSGRGVGERVLGKKYYGKEKG